jgi:predicted dehydrogenase
MAWTIRDTSGYVCAHDSGAGRPAAAALCLHAPEIWECIPRFRLSGSEATVVVTSSMDGQEAALVAGRTPSGEGADQGPEAQTAWGTLHPGTGSEVVPSERGRWDQFYEQFAAAVRGTAPVPVDPWDAVATATVLDAARRSATDGTTVMVPMTSQKPQACNHSVDRWRVGLRASLSCSSWPQAR